MFCVFLIGCQTADLKVKEKPTIPVMVARPNVKDVNRYVESMGTLEAFYYVEIRSEIAGVLETIFVKQGDDVSAGDPLFRIDSKGYEIKVKEAEAQLMMDQASYEAALKKLERYRSLAEKDLVAQIEWDEIQESADKTKAIMEADRAHLDSAKLDKERCTLTAPAGGRVGRFDLHPGSLIGREEMLTSISGNNPLIVNFTLTEREFAKLPPGELAVEVRLLCGKGCSSMGKVTFLDSRFDASTGSIFVRGELQNHDDRLRPGQRVSVRVPVAVDPQKTLISLKAIKYNQEGPYVYVVSKENTIEFRQLILGEEVGDEIVAEEGIGPEEMIVTSGNARLTPGLKVEIRS